MLYVLAIMWAAVIYFIVIEQPNNRSRTEWKVDALRRRVDAIAEHLGITADPCCPPEVSDLAKSGRKIDAIKAYRKATGAGLAEAKGVVEKLMHQEVTS